MNGILHWNDVVAYLGDGVSVHEQALSKATDATHGLLACRFVPTDTAKFVSRKGLHAERDLVRSTTWKHDIDQALSTWDPRGSAMLVLLMLNRSPCGDCAQILANALHEYNDRYALTTERQHFVLASLGYYHSHKPSARGESGSFKTFTTDKGLSTLTEAGWKLCTLEFGNGLTRRGQELHTYLSGLPRWG